jgi:hypothetical protein
LKLDLEPAVFQAGDKLREYAALVTDVQVPIESMAQLYRDRADAENAFDELKNQWGLSGITCCPASTACCFAAMRCRSRPTARSRRRHR